MVVALAIAVVGGFQTGFPVGSYKPDVSKAPVETRCLLQAYFGQALLVVRPNGEFELSGIEQEGYWRKSGDKFVFVYDGFLSIQSTEPEKVLRKAWPSNNLEGMILRKGADGTLTLSDFGRVPGPVIFRPMPRRTIAQLIAASNPPEGADQLSAAAGEAWSSLKDRIEAEWPKVLRFINDPKRSAPDRGWAAILLDGLQNPKGIEATARLILNIKPTNVRNRDQSLRGSLARVVAEHPTENAADLLIEGQRRGLLSPADVAPALRQLNRKTDIPVLLPWLTSKREYDKSETLEALTILEAEEALSIARTLTIDPAEGVQLAAYGLIARTSPDPIERKEAISKLAKWIKSSEFLLPFAAVDALCRSKAPEALPHLVAILGSDMPFMNRRNTAMALGNLGDIRAVPALIEAKSRPSGGPDTWAEESRVRRAVAEALVQLGNLKRSGD
jgi:HEAT repeat protein